MSVSNTTVLGKRKTRATGSLLLHLSASESNYEHSDYSYQESETDTPKPKAKRGLILVNGSLIQDTKKKYKCTFDGCEKVYSKPCRLEEHGRSHTGEASALESNIRVIICSDHLMQRPFVCTTCNKSYLRETHLQAHARCHLSESERPLECPEPGCGKRFWTAQHLRVHESGHRGEKPWKVIVPSFCRCNFGDNYIYAVH
jgi:general transcription factor IIIA